jgi:hypothetical protein
VVLRVLEAPNPTLAFALLGGTQEVVKFVLSIVSDLDIRLEETVHRGTPPFFEPLWKVKSEADNNQLVSMTY